MNILSFLLILSQSFAGNPTPEQCDQILKGTLSGGSVSLNQQLTHYCKTLELRADDGYFMNLKRTGDINYNHKKDCDLKSDNGLGFLKKVVMYTDMKSDSFYPDSGDQYPYVFAIQVPDMLGETNVGNAVGVDVGTVKGCREKIEALLGKELKSERVIMTAGHHFVSSKGAECKVADNSNINSTYLASGKDVSNYSFLTKPSNVMCASTSCNEIDNEIYKDFCVIIPENEIQYAAKYKNSEQVKAEESHIKLVAYQSALVKHSKRSNLRASERMISLSNDKIKIHTKPKVSKKKDVIHHYADASIGASGGGLFDENNNIFGLHITESKVDNGIIVQKGIKGTWMGNYGVDIQKACQNLSVVLN